MNKLKQLTQKIIDEKKPKIEVATALIWYHFIVNNEESSIPIINDYFQKANIPKYNSTYLKADLRKSKNVTKGTKIDSYKPQQKYVDEMAFAYPFILPENEEIKTDDIVIPKSLVLNTRGYIHNLVDQINASYYYNIFDGCAILMRRLLEILLIHSYEKHNRSQDIEDKDGFKNLSYIINYTISNKPFKLSKDSFDTLDGFRQLGNFSAHKIQYNAKRKDLDNIKLQYRMTIEELLYASGIKK